MEGIEFIPTNYPSDLTDAQWEEITERFPQELNSDHHKRSLINAVLYLITNRVEQDLSDWIKRIKECLTIDCLTRAIVVELIDRIEVSEIYDVNGEKSLDINIFYRFSKRGSSRDPQKRNRAV